MLTRRLRWALPALVLALAAALPQSAGAWPGLNGFLAYGSSRTGGQFSDDVYLSPLDVETPLRRTVRTVDDGQPAWSPDGARLAFKSAQFGSNNLAVMNTDGSDEAILTRTFRVSEGQPAWSPDGKQLLYRSTPQNPLVQDGDIWVLDVEASRLTPLTPVTDPVLLRPGDERYPTFSPDGTRIAFRAGDLVEANGDEEIYVMNADGTDVRQLTSNADFDSAPVWSPDGTKIAFENAPGDTLQPPAEAHEKDIYVMNADGTDVRRLTDSPGLDEGPVWSPDGTKMAFSSDRDGQQELYVMNADGSDQRRLTDNPARDESPDWQPLPFPVAGHDACGDVSQAKGGASSVVQLGISCRKALRVAGRWADEAVDGTPPASLQGYDCDTALHSFDQVVVHCAHRGDDARRDIGFVWRDPAIEPK